MNEVQRIQLTRLRLGSFNQLDGNRVADSLEKNENLWKAFVFGRFKYCTLLELRDLPEGVLNADEIYLLAERKHVAKLLKLIKRDWLADEVGVFTLDEEWSGTAGMTTEETRMAFPGLLKGEALIRVWWD